jgi:hypothetical protein
LNARHITCQRSNRKNREENKQFFHTTIKFSFLYAPGLFYTAGVGVGVGGSAGIKVGVAVDVAVGVSVGVSVNVGVGVSVAVGISVGGTGVIVGGSGGWVGFDVTVGEAVNVAVGTLGTHNFIPTQMVLSVMQFTCFRYATDIR